LESVPPRIPALSRRVDDYVGARIRLRRTLLGMTQEQLAVALAIFLPAGPKIRDRHESRQRRPAFRACDHSGRQRRLFLRWPGPRRCAIGASHGGRNRIAIDLVRNFLEIANEDQRTALANLVKTLRVHGEAEKASASS